MNDEKENLKARIEKKQEEIAKERIRLKKKKEELQFLTDRYEALLRKEEADFNEKVVASLKERFGSFDKESFSFLLDSLGVIDEKRQDRTGAPDADGI